MQKEVQIKQNMDRINKKGYKEIYVSGKRILEHRDVVSKFLNRNLLPSEIVHHLNEKKLDNKIENLMLFKTNKEHTSFHRKVQQFGFTNPIKKMIKNRWKI